MMQCKQSTSSRRRTVTIIVLGTTLSIVFPPAVAAESYSMIPRWGHASTFIPSPPALLIQGGKTDPTSAYTYTSSPNSGDTILLPLTSAFNTSLPPFLLMDAVNPPAHAWHTLSALVAENGNWSVLSFGGDGGTSEAVQTQADSTWLLSVHSAGNSVNYTHEPTSWANQPMRRMYHSTASSGNGGRTYISGGLKDDGSGTTFADVYLYDPASSAFTALPGLPQAIYHHSSVLLSNGTLIVLGGVYTSPVTESAAVIPFSTLYVLDTTSNVATWVTQTVVGNVPTGRRGATAVLNGIETTAFVFGGADAALATVFGDGWELNLSSCTWQQVVTGDQGAGSRFDHSAVAIGGDQVAIFGGYATAGSADADLYVYDMAINSWITSFTPPQQPELPSSSSPSGSESSGTASSVPAGTSVTPSGTAMSGTEAEMGKTAGQSATRLTAADGSLTGSTGASTVGTVTQSHTSISPTSGAAGDQSPLSSAPIRIGLVLGMLALAGLVAGGLLYRHRRRRQALLGRSTRGSPAEKSCSSRPYGPREKGGIGLMEDAAIDGSPAFHEREKPVVDLGMGAIGSSLANISNKFARQAYNDTYAVLRESDEAGASGIFRDPTRRFGSGIRLVGPRSPPIRDKYAPIRLSRAFSPSRDSRIDILRDEDSRNFAKRPEVDWVLPSDDSEGQWKPAHSLLGGQRDIAEEDDPFDDDESLRPPMRGGPVPTPQGSRSDLDPFEDIPRHRNSFTEASGSRSVTVPLPALSRSDHLDLDIFLAPPLEGRQESGISLPRSLRSMQSGTTSDAEEGIVQHAQIGSHHRVSLISPVETACLPIKRSESFFRRMTAGGISSLLSRQVTSPQQQQQQLDIRDPAPLPTLWQVKSREDLSYLSTSLGVEALQPPQPSHGKGLSLSSLQSAKSMRNMVIMQREATISSIETEAVIETASPLLLETERPEGAGHHRHGLTMGTETPGSIVFNGAAFASPVRLPVPNAGPSRPTLDPSPPMEAESSPSPLLAPDRPPSTPTRQVPLPPTDSPVPSPLLSHRRPVRDVVNSINKRASATPLSLFSPESQYSPAPISPQTTGRSGSTTRPSTIYEAVRRSPLTVTNPDWGGGRPSSTSE